MRRHAGKIGELSGFQKNGNLAKDICQNGKQEWEPRKTKRESKLNFKSEGGEKGKHVEGSHVQIAFCIIQIGSV